MKWEARGLLGLIAWGFKSWDFFLQANIRINNGMNTEPLGCFQKKYTNIDVGLIVRVIISNGNDADFAV